MTLSDEKKAQYLWTGFILAFFMIQAILWSVAITLTANDTSHAVVDDYEQKAVRWDQSQAAMRASEALGWRAKLEALPDPDLPNVRTIELTLTESDRGPVEIQAVSLNAFHTGHAAEVQTLILESIGPGIYAGNLRVREFGQWKFSGHIDVGQDHFLLDQRIWIE